MTVDRSVRLALAAAMLSGLCPLRMAHAAPQDVAATASRAVDVPLLSRPEIARTHPWQRTRADAALRRLFSACPGVEREWRSASVTVDVRVWRCPIQRDAPVALWKWVQESSDEFVQVQLNEPVGAFMNRETESVARRHGSHAALASFARGPMLVVVLSSGPQDESHSLPKITAEVARQQADVMTGTPAMVSKAQIDWSRLITIPLTIYLLTILPWRLWHGRVGRVRHTVRRGDPDWRDVGQTAERVKWALRQRAACRWTAVVCVPLAVVAPRLEGSAFWLAVATAAVAGGWLRPPAVTRAWRTARPPRARFADPRTWAAPMVGLAAALCAVTALCLVVYAALVEASGLTAAPMLVDGIVDERYLGIPESDVQQFVLATSAAGDLGSLAEMAATAALILVGCAVGLRRLTRRLTVADAPSALRRDSRPLLLYLRSFEDDAIKMPSSGLARATLFERLSPVARQPFEEILTRHVGTIGPVVGLSPPGTRLPPLGAARASAANELWQGQIADWLNRARAVVLSATPAQVHDGLRFELAVLRRSEQLPLILVIGPHRRKQLSARWATFLTAAQDDHRLASCRGALSEDGALVILLNPGAPCVVWGAKRRTEWTYAVALREAVAAATSGPAASPRPKWLPPTAN